MHGNVLHTLEEVISSNCGELNSSWLEDQGLSEKPAVSSKGGLNSSRLERSRTLSPSHSLLYTQSGIFKQRGTHGWRIRDSSEKPAVSSKKGELNSSWFERSRMSSPSPSLSSTHTAVSSNRGKLKVFTHGNVSFTNSKELKSLHAWKRFTYPRGSYIFKQWGNQLFMVGGLGTLQKSQ